MRSELLTCCSLGRPCPRSCQAIPHSSSARPDGARGLARLIKPLGRCKVLNAGISFERTVQGRGLMVSGLGSDESSAEVPLMERIQPGVITRVFSSQELTEVLQMKKDNIVIMQCKAKTCRPCMSFAKKYMRLADAYKDFVFLEIYGDQSNDTRKLMMEFGVKATPTFRLYSNGEHQDTVVGINQNKLESAIRVVAGIEVVEEEQVPVAGNTSK